VNAARFRRVALAGAPAVLLLAGCAPTARVVLVEPGRGAVAIHRNTPASREKALALIAQQCPRGYAIVREEEVVTGETVTTDYETEYDRTFDEVRTTEEQRIRRTVEWRITYTCN
jgi:DNA-binding IclR family transcriptional regulator